MNLTKKFKRNKGITLIALVVTIIVLLILAGISISMLTGQNGILNRASEAKNLNGIAQNGELVKLSAMDALSQGLGTITDANLKTALNRNRRKKERRRMVISALIELLILVLLAGAFCWNRGLSARVSGFLGVFDRPPVKELDVTGVNSSNVVLMDVKSGAIIGDLNGKEQIYPASMTKIMTAIVALEAFSDLDHEITLSENIFYALDGHDATQAGFQPGESVRVRDLVYGVMLPSGAECCLALADEASGSEEAFVEKMNKKAKSIGMKDTHFMDCTGLHDPEHYSTAYDIALLLKYALHNDTFREVAESHFHSTPATNVHPDGITYYSTMFKNMSDTSVTGGEILGGKTGYTSEAGHCLASFAQIYDREYILVTAGAAADATGVPHILDAKTIYNRLGEAVAQK